LESSSFFYSHVCYPTADLLAGSIAGVIATFVATPADVVKTRILSQDVPRQQKFGVGSPIGATAMFPEEPKFGMGLLSQRRTTSATAMAATRKSTMMEPEKLYVQPDRNPFVVGYKIVQKEGAMVLLSGVTERCMGAIPRFGLTLSLYDVLKTMAADQPWM
jgi:Mitochondrial carrier protein